ncbi:carabin isoform X1 [Hemicordylus capensis]|uniref:carabin isoform X1 n=1 Tax=Hemicordylus capensis TaxID=884348 RepID=UPI0023043317|nr:carabin isoform X1 [Hemicordylus capensis]
MSELSLSVELPNKSQTQAELPDDFSLSRDDASSLGSDSELNAVPPYRQTDRYGFIGGSGLQDGPGHISAELIRHRETKWLEMTAHWDKTMARRYRKVKLLCRKGIPSSLRARCWPLLCGGQTKMKRSFIKYQELQEAPGDSQWVETITKDIHRQFPFHEMFLSPEGPGQQGLLQLLKAYTVYRPQEGYCQAQGPLGALLLMHMPPEEALLLDSEVFVALLRRVCPKALKHLQKHGVGPLLYIPEWFLCLFARTLPFPTVLRVWDAFLSEGVKVLFRVGLLLVRLALGSSEKLRDCTGLLETLEKLRSIPAHLLQEDIIMAQVHDIPVSDRDLERECRVQLAKMRKSQPDFQYTPEHRLSGAKAIFDAQQLADAQNHEGDPGSHTVTFHIPQIKVEPPPLSPKEQQRQLDKASEVQGQKKLKTRKKPDTRGKTFHVTQDSTESREERVEPGTAKRKSFSYTETWF